MRGKIDNKSFKKISRRRFLQFAAIGGAAASALGFPRVSRVQAAKRVTIPAQKQALDGRYLGGIVRYLIQ